jgi:stalled ribosome rescue protein Dom34
MKTNIGLWIDHRRAVIVTETGDGDKVQEVLSNTERQLGRIDGERSLESFEAQKVKADDVHQRKFTEHLHRYYLNILAHVTHARAILIFGPGEAKGELYKQLESSMPKDCVITVETTDKMTDRQITAKVREHFKHQSPVIELHG